MTHNFYRETEYNYSKIIRLASMLNDLAQRQAPHAGAYNPDILDMVNRATRYASCGHGWSFSSVAIKELIVFYCVYADAKDYPHRMRILRG